MDGAGNAFVIGTFTTQATFGPNEPNETVLTSVGAVASQDLFLAKYAGDGTLLWARGIGGSDPDSGGAAGLDSGTGVAVNGDGHAFITGTLNVFTTLADFGDGVFLESPGPFVARYDGNGTAMWARTLEVSGQPWAIALDPAGNSYVTGSAPDPILGGGIATLWKLDPEGHVLWKRQATGGDAGGIGAAADGGGVTVAGRFSGTVTFGPGEATETELTWGNGSGETFVARYDGDGNLLWATQTLSDIAAWAESVDTDAQGNSYVTGPFHGTTVFGPGETHQTTLVSVHVADMYLAKFDANGDLVWVQHGSGNFNAYGLAVRVDATGSPFVTGYFGLFLTLGAGQPNETTLDGLGGGDVFVAKFEPGGLLQWARSAGGAGLPYGDWGTGIAVDATGTVTIAGFFQNSATFGAGEPGQTILTSVGETDIFVARYRNDGAPPAPLDLDIARLRVTSRASLKRGGVVDIALVVRNGGTTAGAADATIVGVQDGVEVYRVTMPVTDGVGNGRTTHVFPSFTALLPADITWTATIADQDPDVDQATSMTRVVP